MALELLAVNDCAAVIDRVRVTTGAADPYPASDLGGPTILIEGRGILAGGSNRRYVVQPDGAYAEVGLSRFALLGQSATLGLCGVGGQRGYLEYEANPWRTTPTTDGRAYALSGVTLQGARDVAAAPQGNPQAAALLPDGAWLSPSFTFAGVSRFVAGRWSIEQALPVFGANYLSWGDEPSEIWLCNGAGEGVSYDFERRRVGLVVRTRVANMGMFYSRRHRVFLTIGMGAGGVRRVWVHARTPRPYRIAQTVEPSPVAGRVSRVRAVLLGEDGEPCEGEPVQWSCTTGYLVVPIQSVTDADGVALADLVVPMGATGAGFVSTEVVI